MRDIKLSIPPFPLPILEFLDFDVYGKVNLASARKDALGFCLRIIRVTTLRHDSSWLLLNRIPEKEQI
jgi:hypothetical protein